jgi:hypothetical protein
MFDKILPWHACQGNHIITGIRARVLLMLCFVPLALMPRIALAAESNVVAPEPTNNTNPKALFETHCSACHSLELPRSQRLDRKTWQWVMDDMVNTFGATWITEQQQRLIIDYLVKNYGPDPS